MQHIIFNLALIPAIKGTANSPSHIEVGISYVEGQGVYLVAIPVRYQGKHNVRVTSPEIGVRSLLRPMEVWDADEFLDITPQVEEVSLLLNHILSNTGRTLKYSRSRSVSALVQSALRRSIST